MTVIFTKSTEFQCPHVYCLTCQCICCWAFSLAVVNAMVHALMAVSRLSPLEVQSDVVYGADSAGAGQRERAGRGAGSSHQAVGGILL